MLWSTLTNEEQMFLIEGVDMIHCYGSFCDVKHQKRKSKILDAVFKKFVSGLGTCQARLSMKKVCYFSYDLAIRAMLYFFKKRNYAPSKKWSRTL